MSMSTLVIGAASRRMLVDSAASLNAAPTKGLTKCHVQAPPRPAQTLPRTKPFRWASKMQSVCTVP